MDTSFRVLQIDHVELFVPDQYEAAAWYARVLGLQIVPDCEHWAKGGGPLMISSDAGSTMLALFEGHPTPSPETAAFRRVAFRVDAAGFSAFLQRLPDLKVVDHGQALSIYFTDPYGHRLEVTTYEVEQARSKR